MIDFKYVSDITKTEVMIFKSDDGKVTIAIDKPATSDEPDIFLSCPLPDNVADILGRILLKENKNEF